VKGTKQIIDFLKSVVLSGFVLLFLSSGVGAKENSYLDRNPQGTTHLSLATTDLYSLVSGTERFFENVQRVPTSPSKINFGDYLSVVNLTESNRSHLLTRNITFARHKVLPFQSHDIVYPFHSFW